MASKSLDTIDRRIVAALQADGRLTNVKLAERIGLPRRRLACGA